jgi:hypothetical protein
MLGGAMIVRVPVLLHESRMSVTAAQPLEIQSQFARLQTSFHATRRANTTRECGDADLGWLRIFHE